MIKERIEDAESSAFGLLEMQYHIYICWKLPFCVSLIYLKILKRLHKGKVSRTGTFGEQAPKVWMI